jgi:hypothetical protein
MSEDDAEFEPEIDVEFTEEHVGLPVLSSETYIIGTVTDLQENILVVEKEPGADLDVLSTGLPSSGDGQLAVLPGQVDRVTEDGVFLK